MGGTLTFFLRPHMSILQNGVRRVVSRQMALRPQARGMHITGGATIEEYQTVQKHGALSETGSKIAKGLFVALTAFTAVQPLVSHNPLLPLSYTPSSKEWAKKQGVAWKGN